MIAMVLGLILLAGTLSIFLSTRQGYGVNNAISRVQESGRFALDYIYNDARMAGYMGCATSTQTTNYLNPVAGSNLAFDFTTAIKGYEYNNTGPNDTYPVGSSQAEQPNVDTNTGDWSPTLDSDLQNWVMPGTDVLVVRFSGGQSPVYITDIPGSPSPNSPSADFHVNVNGGLQTGDLLVVSNCVNSVILQATQINGSPNGPDTNIVHNTGNSEYPGNAIQGLPSAFVGAQVMLQPITVVFYIGKGVDNSPALYEAVTNTSGVNGFSSMELVPQVEDMQVLFGVDLTNSNAPTEYETAAAVDATGEWSNVVSVRVGLLVRSDAGAVPMPKTAPTFNLLGSTFTAPKDTRLRKIFTATIALRNRLH